MSSLRMIVAFAFFAVLPILVNASSDPFDVTDRYIVTLQPGVDIHEHVSHVNSLQNGTFAGITDKYSFGNFAGYVGHFDQSVVEQLRVHENVDVVEKDQVLYEEAAERATCSDGCSDSAKCGESDQKSQLVKRLLRRDENELTSQNGAPWNLESISNKGKVESIPDRETFSNLSELIKVKNRKYWYRQSAGSKTYAYVIGEGIRETHSDFGGRARLVYNPWGPGHPNDDSTGLGTHYGSIIGGNRYGVAKRTHIFGVKVTIGGRTVASKLIVGYSWAVKDISTKKRYQRSVVHVAPYHPERVEGLQKAIREAQRQGVVTVGPGGDRAPARYPISVGHTDRWRLPGNPGNDLNWNFGTIDLFGPGVGICSADSKDDKAIAQRSGIAQASAHVAGLVVYLKSFNKIDTVEATKDLIMRTATQGVVKGPNGDKKPFAYNGSGK
ncbi:subtilisin-like protein [Myriangium duriaei CBS 260.36]|uniref:Subtilisin-like protein n=1 Tax=Myriangium duriaei CBS 260.36 TaxID=1168546 RepID=A0A9P4J287_9PEZI|nr:subtilisin-like protein [Myriangium duriaei CBS 260.36]